MSSPDKLESGLPLFDCFVCHPDAAASDYWPQSNMLTPLLLCSELTDEDVSPASAGVGGSVLLPEAQ